MTTQHERRQVAVELATRLRQLADRALVADSRAVDRALVYAQRLELELTSTTTDRQ